MIPKYHSHPDSQYKPVTISPHFVVVIFVIPPIFTFLFYVSYYHSIHPKMIILENVLGKGFITITIIIVSVAQTTLYLLL